MPDKRNHTTALFVVLFALTISPSAFGQLLNGDLMVENVSPGTTFATPTGIAIAPDGRIFVAQKSGVVMVIENGVTLPTPFINLAAEVLDHHDRGLLGIALDPGFSENGYVYFAYTWDHNGGGDMEREDIPGRLVRYTADSTDRNIADLSSEFVLIGETYTHGIPCCFYSHSVGSIRFGTDGSLFIGAGDGASYNEVDPGGLYPDCFGPPEKFDWDQDIGAFRSQSLASLSGKILRLNPGNGKGLPTNPFFNGNPDDPISKIWAYGLRNPFRFYVRTDGSTDPGVGDPGTLYIADVGWTQVEELNIATGGENFGWPCYEGVPENGPYGSVSPYCSAVSDVVSPTLYWNHWDGGQSFPPGLTGRSIIGAAFYDGTIYPEKYHGKAFYADYIDGWLACAEFDTTNTFVSQTVLSTDVGFIVDIVYDPESEYLYFTDVVYGTVNRIILPTPPSPPELTRPDSGAIDIGTDLTLEWLRPVGTEFFHLQVSESSDFSTLLIDEEDLLDPSYDIVGLGNDDTYYWRAAARNILGSSEWSATWSFSTSLTGVDGEEPIPGTFILHQNYPNPFNPSTTIRYEIPVRSGVRLTVFDPLGQLVQILHDGPAEAGGHSVLFDAGNIPSGIYFYRLQAGSFTETRKLLLVR